MHRRGGRKRVGARAPCAEKRVFVSPSRRERSIYCAPSIMYSAGRVMRVCALREARSISEDLLVFRSTYAAKDVAPPLLLGAIAVVYYP